MPSGNVVMGSVPGCHIAHYDAPWLVDNVVFDMSELGLKPGEHVPDLSVDPSTNLLTVINSSDHDRSYVITLQHPAFDVNRRPLAMGSMLEEGKEVACITFVLVLSANTLMDVCYLGLKRGQSLQKHLKLSSDVTDLLPHPNPTRFDPVHTYAFPLPAGRYLCSQGICGHLTHFYPQTMHAIDLECPVGTPVLAIGDGVVVDVQQHNTVSGAHVDFLFKWNSLTVRMGESVYVDYVHIKTGSSQVKEGDVVVKGQHLCDSGAVGFCPKPHLHIQISLSNDLKVPTEKFAFRDASGEPYFPQAGKYYSVEGAVP